MDVINKTIYKSNIRGLQIPSETPQDLRNRLRTWKIKIIAKIYSQSWIV